MRYVLYARKSSEGDDRQIQSIDDQLDLMRAYAQRRGLHVVKEIVEQKSAKAPGRRPGFLDMVKTIEAGRADAILTYHLNRLSRNPLESGLLGQHLQDGLIKEIATSDRCYLSEDNAVLFGLEGSIANQYSRDLSKVVKRGMASRADKGWKPGQAPLGYLNDRFDKRIVLDPKTSADVRRAWDLALGGASIRQIATAMAEWGFETPLRKYGGSKPIAYSTVYAMLKNPFYTGHFWFKGELMVGLHEPIISFPEYTKVQGLLNRDVKPKKHSFAFSGLMRCGHCNCMVTAERRSKRLADGTCKEYVYYHCTNSKGTCSQKCIEEKKVVGCLSDLVANLEMRPEFAEWGNEVITRWRQDATLHRKEAEHSQQSRLSDVGDRLDELLDMRTRKLIDDEDYLKKRASLLLVKNNVVVDIATTAQEAEEVLEELEYALELTQTASERFNMGGEDDRLDLLKEFGTRYVLKDGIIQVELKKVFRLVREGYEKMLSEIKILEPGIVGTPTGLNTTKKDLLKQISYSWWAILENIRNELIGNKTI